MALEHGHSIAAGESAAGAVIRQGEPMARKRTTGSATKRTGRKAKQDVLPIKDGDASHPVPTAWRGPLRDVVNAFARADYALSREIPSVAPVSKRLAKQIPDALAGYGETLAELPDKTWRTSVAQWTGDHWEVLVDLWTVESGPSDLVLHADVFEAKDGFRIKLHLVYVP